MNFNAKRFRARPATQLLKVTLLDSVAQSTVIEFVAPQTRPTWLRVDVTGAPPEYTVALSITTTDLLPAQKSAVFSVGTFTAAGAPLRTQEVTVNYTVIESLGTSRTTLDPAFVFGHPTTSSADSVLVFADPNSRWTATSSQSWVTVPGGEFTGPGTLPIAVDASSLIPGIATATITLANLADSADTAEVKVTATVNEPALTTSPAAVVIGKDDGLDFTGGENVQVALATGSNSYPLAATVTTANGVAWLGRTPSGGIVGANTLDLSLNADRSLVSPGSYAGTLRLAATIKGRTITHDVPVTLNKEAHWLHVSGLGTAFSKFPSRSVLTRTFDVRSSQGRSDVPWTAISNQPWLNVTASGLTGGDLVLTANPAGLADGQYYATVTVSSSRADVLNTQVMRVGLRVGSTDPGEFSLPLTPSFVVANPVDPYVYTNTNFADIVVYDVYDGSVVRTFNIPGGRTGRMTVSHDGRTLFVSEVEARTVYALDAHSGAVLRQFPWPSDRDSHGIAYMRPNGHPLLMLGGGPIFDADTAALHTATHGARWYQGRVTLLGDVHDTYLYAYEQAVNPPSLEQHLIGYTALHADGVSTKLMVHTSTGSNGSDMCLSTDGLRLYPASGFPYEFHEIDTLGFHLTRILEGALNPNNAACGWNGLFVGGTYNILDVQNIWAYRPDGTQIAKFSLHPSTSIATLRDETLVLSGDNTRLIGSTEFPSLDFRVAPTP